MTRVVVIHSFKRGTGKTSLAANLAFLKAAAGKRVGLVDASTQYPDLHLPFGLPKAPPAEQPSFFEDPDHWPDQIAKNLTSHLPQPRNVSLFLISIGINQPNTWATRQKELDVLLLGTGIHQFAQRYQLDTILVDTDSGLSQTSLTAFAVAEILMFVLRPDHQDLRGTQVLLDLASRLEIQKCVLVANMLPSQLDVQDVRQSIEKTLNGRLSAALPYSPEVFLGGVTSLFCLEHPTHPFSVALKELAHSL